MTAEEYINRAKREDYPGGHLTYIISVDDALEAVRLAREEKEEIIQSINRETIVECEPKADWQQIETQAAIGAMQVMLANGVPTTLQYQYTKDADNHQVIATEAVQYAKALVAELKKGGDNENY